MRISLGRQREHVIIQWHAGFARTDGRAKEVVGVGGSIRARSSRFQEDEEKALYSNSCTSCDARPRAFCLPPGIAGTFARTRDQIRRSHDFREFFESYSEPRSALFRLNAAARFTWKHRNESSFLAAIEQSNVTK